MSQWRTTVPAPSVRSRKAAQVHQQRLTKPPGSLGRLEQIAVDFAGWQDRVMPRVEKVSVCVFAGDHGVVEEGVSAFPQTVTGQMILNFAAGGAAIAVLARLADADFSVVNLGTATPVPETRGVINAQLAPGCANFCKRAAMSPALLNRALQCGADAAPTAADIFIGGEMGIGNSTAAAALVSALLDLPPEATVGRGTGIDDAALAVKRAVVQRGLDLHQGAASDALDMLRRLGGLEIAALTGAYIACAQRRIPSLVDGYICTAAALVACRVNPGVRDWLLFAHRSEEPGHRHLLKALSADPLLDLGMRLGEGSGAATALPLLRSACALHAEMATFADAGVADREAPT